MTLFGRGQGREETRREKQGASEGGGKLLFSSVKFDEPRRKKFIKKGEALCSSGEASTRMVIS